MRDPKRIKKILKRLEKIWKQYPDLRLGQLIENVFSSDEGSQYNVSNIAEYYFYDDEHFIRCIEDFYNDDT